MTVDDKRKFLIDIAFIVLIAAIFYFVLKFCTAYLLPFLIGLLLAVIVQKPAQFLSKRLKVKKSLISVLLVLVLYLLTMSLLAFIAFFVYGKISDLLSALPGYLTVIGDAFDSLSAKFFVALEGLPDEISKAILNLPDTIISNVAGLATTLLSTSATVIAKSGPGILVSVIVTIVASCYIAKDYDIVMSFVHTHTTERVNRIFSATKKIFFESILKMGKSYFLLMMVTFAELSLGLLIIGVKNPISVAAIIAFVDILPVLGTGAVVIPWAIISLVTGSVWRGVGLAVLYLVITVVRNFLEPKVIGDQVGLHPLITLVAMFVGLRLFGIIGVFVCPIIIIILVGLEKDGVINLFGKRSNNKN